MFETKSPVELRARSLEESWLIDSLWANEAVGILGGEPKCCKSFLGLDMAVSVAAGVPCLGRFEVKEKGPALVFQAQDAEHVVRERLDGIATAKGLKFDELAIRVMTMPSLRIDEEEDQHALRATVEHHSPRLLVLDPLVRLHSGSENYASTIAAMLGFLRELQRTYQVAILLVHHLRKSTSDKVRPGQRLRGSGDLHGWGDTNLFMERKGEQLFLSSEQRASNSFEGLLLELRPSKLGGLALHVLADASENGVEGDAQVGEVTKKRETPRDRIEAVLRDAGVPLSIRKIRERVHMRTNTVCEVLRALTQEGRVLRGKQGYRPLCDSEERARRQDEASAIDSKSV